jgi:hypothetical protein
MGNFLKRILRWRFSPKIPTAVLDAAMYSQKKMLRLMPAGGLIIRTAYTSIVQNAALLSTNT